ncbi:hypothetical protein [Clostridium botulinum]|uniref:hypothetical protein n=1 Tax=Clostridium botulinum TaxID=1491 RepID=UPI0007E0F8BA|nr:hypothetical protein [Clostridium botulinum]KEI75887.1 hypothetical protein N486_08945 [Clostridium botulinum B2 128]KEI92033.1 hypothetical protein N491_09095 [Clostridium botulinum B2 275]
MKYTEKIGDIEHAYEAETPEKINNLYSKLNDGETKLKSATVEELLEMVMRKPIPVDYVSKKQVKSYIEKLIECYERNFKYI